MTNLINNYLRLKIVYTYIAKIVNLKYLLIAFAKPNLSQKCILQHLHISERKTIFDNIQEQSKEKKLLISNIKLAIANMHRYIQLAKILLVPPKRKISFGTLSKCLFFQYYFFFIAPNFAIAKDVAPSPPFPVFI